MKEPSSILFIKGIDGYRIVPILEKLEKVYQDNGIDGAIRFLESNFPLTLFSVEEVYFKRGETMNISKESKQTAAEIIKCVVTIRDPQALRENIEALVEANAQRRAQVAMRVAELEQQGGGGRR